MNERVLFDAGLDDVRDGLQAEVTRRWTHAAREVKRAILQNDALGISDKAPRLAVPTADKAAMFRRWLDERLVAGVSGYGGEWLSPHVEAAAARGTARVAMGDAGPDDEPRDDRGRWTFGGAAARAEPSGVGGVGEKAAGYSLEALPRLDFHPDPAKPIGAEARNYVLQHGRETDSEYLVAIGGSGKPIAVLGGDKHAVGFTPSLEAATEDGNSGIVVHHNHPSGGSLSGMDISQLAMPGIVAIWAHGNNGTSYRAALTPEARAIVAAPDVTGLNAKANRMKLFLAHDMASQTISNVVRPMLAGAIPEARETLTAAADLNHPGWVNHALAQAGIIDYRSGRDELPVAHAFGIDGAIAEGARTAKEIFYGRHVSGALDNPDRPAQPLRLAGDVGTPFGGPAEAARRHAAQDGADRAGRDAAGVFDALDAQQGIDFLVSSGAPSAKVCHAASAGGLAEICDDVSTRAHASVAHGLLTGARSAQIAKLVDQAMGHGLRRTRLLAEHSVTQAYSQATLDGLEAKGVRFVGTISEHRRRNGAVGLDALEQSLVCSGLAESGWVRQDMAGGAAADDAAALADFDPDEPRDEIGRWTASGSTAHAGYEFVSPNVGNIGFGEAKAALQSHREQALLEASTDVDHAVGAFGVTSPVIGAWADGAEHSTMTVVDHASWDSLRLAAAIKGHLADQKQVLIFKEAEEGEKPTAALYSFDAQGDLGAIHQRLLDDGVAFHTLQPKSDGATVWIADTERSTETMGVVQRAAHGAHIDVRDGQAEFLGTPQETGTDREQRDDARRAYDRIIAESPVHGAASIWQGLHHRWGQALQALTDALRDAYDPDQPRDDLGKWTVSYGGRQGSYDPKFFKTEDDPLEDEHGVVVGNRQRLVATREANERPPIEDDPSLMYRGMSHAEYEAFRTSGEIKTQGDYNLSNQAGLTYFTTESRAAETYSNAFAPWAHKPDFGKPAYIVAAKRVGAERLKRIAGTGEHELGVMGPVAKSDVVGVWRGTVIARDPGEKDRLAPSARLHWQKVMDALDTWDEWFADAARKTPQPKHPRSGQFAKAHVVARESRRSKKTGQFRRQGLAPEEQRKEELREARFGRVIGRLDVQTAEDDKVCLRCDQISQDGPYSINEARSLIPAHPNCRCLFVAAGAMRDAGDLPYRTVSSHTQEGRTEADVSGRRVPDRSDFYLAHDFDPDEPRDESGKWTSGGGITAYHGSPHDFSQFDLAHMGQGEGSQIYGYGLYLAEEPQVAENYKKTLSGPEGGALYTVQLHASPDQFLDWDKPLSQQSKLVQDYVSQRELGGSLPPALHRDDPTALKWDPTGQQMMHGFIGMGERGAGRLREAGIKGVRYLDQGSRAYGTPTSIEQEPSGKWKVALKDPSGIVTNMRFGTESEAKVFAAKAAKPTRNYVIVDPSVLEITHKNGVALTKAQAQDALDALFDFSPDEPRDPQGRWTALSGSQGHASLISTRPVTAVGTSAEAKEAALKARDVYKTIDMAAMKADPKQFADNANLFRDERFYPGMKESEVGGNHEQVAEAVKNRMVDNLVFLANKVKNGDFGSKGDFKKWAGWYEGAHSIAEGNAKKYGTDIATASGVIAALSPQNDWNGNVYQGDVVMSAMAEKQGMKWDKAMSAKSKAIWKGQRLAMAGEIEGKTLGELDRPMEGDPEGEEGRSLRLARKGMWIRTENEAHSDRFHHQVNPDGTMGDLMRTKAGEPTPARWKSVAAIANAVRAFESRGDANQLSEAMGDRHKVRSFYNNILDPDSPNGDVTIDTHAVGAAWLTPTTAEDVSVYHALNTAPLKVDQPEGWVASRGSAVSGVKGTYGFYAQAYRDAAKQLGIQPRQLQSVVWEAKQRLFSKTQTGTKVKGAVDAVWRRYHSGELTLKAAQNEVVKAAQGSVG